MNIDFAEGDIGSLPFSDQSFDVVWTESVTNFANIHTAVREYYRVLKGGGMLYDREVIAGQQIPGPVSQELCRFFGFSEILSVQDWENVLHESGFSECAFHGYRSLAVDLEAESKYPDNYQYASEGAFLDYRIWETSFQYNELLIKYDKYLSSALMIATKPVKPI